MKNALSPFPIKAPFGTGQKVRYFAAEGSTVTVLGFPVFESWIMPWRALFEGTMVTVEMPLDCRMASKSAKKNVRFFRMGPPTAPPNWLRLNGGILAASKKFRASSALLRRNS